VDILIQNDISGILNYGQIGMVYDIFNLQAEFAPNYPLGERYPIIKADIMGMI
jgi:hypothetical protein